MHFFYVYCNPVYRNGDRSKPWLYVNIMRPKSFKRVGYVINVEGKNMKMRRYKTILCC